MGQAQAHLDAGIGYPDEPKIDHAHIANPGDIRGQSAAEEFDERSNGERKRRDVVHAAPRFLRREGGSPKNHFNRFVALFIIALLLCIIAHMNIRRYGTKPLHEWSSPLASPALPAPDAVKSVPAG
jgi:hypothetical protein